MRILAIDPGSEESAWLIYDAERRKPFTFDITDNYELVRMLWRNPDFKDTFCDTNILVIEMIASYGMPVGRTVFNTCAWIGRFESAFGIPDCKRVYRKDVKLHLCNSMRAKDSNVRQVLIDKFGPGKEKAIGKKKTPGPLYGIRKDLWSALAVAVTWSETHKL